MKRIILSLLTGFGLFIGVIGVYIAGISIWNSTINTADRVWLFNGKELTSAQMRSLSIEMAKDGNARPLVTTCHNPEENSKHYSGVLVDESRGIFFQIENGLEEELPSTTRFQDALACNAVFPNELDPMQYAWFTISSPFRGFH